MEKLHCSRNFCLFLATKYDLVFSKKIVRNYLKQRYRNKEISSIISIKNLSLHTKHLFSHRDANFNEPIEFNHFAFILSCTAKTVGRFVYLLYEKIHVIEILFTHTQIKDESKFNKSVIKN